MKPLILLWSLLFISPLAAHDSWVEINTVRTSAGQPVYASLMLGNHGNEHRDFKLASKIPLEGTTLVVLSPDRRQADLKPRLIDNGLSEKDGFRSVRVDPEQAGLYTVAHTFEAIVHYAPKRVARSGKAFFVAEGSSAKATPKPAAKPEVDSFSKPFGHPLELIPLSDPTRLKTGDTFRARLLFKGEPLKETVVSCIPRGVVLKEGFDPAHQARTDANGEVQLPLQEANFYLLVAQQAAPEETGEGYSKGSAYSATMTLQVEAR